VVLLFPDEQLPKPMIGITASIAKTQDGMRILLPEGSC